MHNAQAKYAINVGLLVHIQTTQTKLCNNGTKHVLEQCENECCLPGVAWKLKGRNTFELQNIRAKYNVLVVLIQGLFTWVKLNF